MENEKVYTMYDEDETEIDLKDLLIQILKHWRKMLVFGILLALLLGGFKGYKAYVSYQAALLEVAADKVDSADQSQSEDVAEKPEDSISRIDEKIDKIKEYQANSILANMKPFDYYWASSRYYVKADRETDPESGKQGKDYTDSVLVAYESTVVDDALLDEVRTVLGVEAEDIYVSEMFLFTGDIESDMITIQAVGRTADEAYAIMDAVRDRMLASKAAITGNVCGHELTLINEKKEHINYDDERSKSDIKVKALQEQYESSYDLLNTKRAEAQATVAEAEKESAVAEFNVSDVVKYAVIGFAAGIFLIMMWYAAFYIMGGTVKTEDDLSRRMKLRVLGRYIKPFGKGGFIDRKIARAEGVTEYNNTAEKVFKLAAANINAMTKDSDKVYIVGTLSEEDIKEAHKGLAKSVKGNLQYGGNVLASAKAIESLSDADKVVIVERLKVSHITDIEREINAVRNLGKEITGVVLI